MPNPAHKNANPFSFRDLTPEQAVLRVSGLSVAVAVILIALKTLALSASGSVAVLASLTDSALDLIASLITFFAVRFARTSPDKEHPFGHGKAEAFSALIQAGLVFFSAALILSDSWAHLRDPQPVSGGALSIAVLIVSLALTGALIYAQALAVKASGSVAVAADRAHYAADLAGNGIALIGVGAAALGVVHIDAIAGGLIALWLLWGAVQVLRSAADHLMDRAMDDEDIARIVEAACNAPEVLDVHRLRTRISGPHRLIQMHMALPADLSLVRAHEIILSAEQRILSVFPNADILIHPDPAGVSEPHGGVFSGVPSHAEQSINGR
ncbi:hypothetical protein AEYBE204_02285 [Asticcacaulis sp. YBE204]|nr:hypothetical protein AEYBE204_02285 [Asticcacaulis sp. YBE204]